MKKTIIPSIMLAVIIFVCVSAAAEDSISSKWTWATVVPTAATPTSETSEIEWGTPVPTPSPSAAPVNIQVGDTVWFGLYEQDGISGNGKEAIQWTVMDIDGQNALLLSISGLDTKPYNEKKTGVTWESCTLRAWLNNDFIHTAFDSVEQAALVQTLVIAERNPFYPNVDAGEDTHDRVFLLSVNELEHYLSYEEQRFCWPTQYAIDRGAYKNKNTGRCRWWMRSPGESSKKASNVFTSGEYWDDYFSVNASGLCVRPAIWVSISALG